MLALRRGEPVHGRARAGGGEALPAAAAVRPTAPGPFALADRTRLARILADAGFRDVAIAPHDEEIGGNDRAGTLELAMNIGPLGRLLRGHPEMRTVVIDSVRAAVEPFLKDGIGRAPSATWIVTARR